MTNVCRASDIFLGALDGNHITSKELIASYPYYHDALTWCVQKTKRIPVWKSILYIFGDWPVLVALLMIIVLLVAVAYYLMQLERNKKGTIQLILIIFGCALGLSVAFNPQSNPMRVLFTFGLFAGIIFATAISSIIMGSITSPIMRPQIDSIREIIDGDFVLAGDQFVLDKLLQQNEVNCFLIFLINKNSN